MKNLKLILVVAAVGLLTAAAAGGAVWWKLGGSTQAAAPAEAGAKKVEAPAKPGPDYKYVTLDKVLIMLRGGSGPGAGSAPHYMAIDVVFKTPPDQEKRAKEHLPLLRTIAVKALSDYTVDVAQGMTVAQFAEELNKAYKDNYAAEQHEPPFAEALIGKLIIE
jgi:flagellar FliL protein